jgi:hypothetical protein
MENWLPFSMRLPAKCPTNFNPLSYEVGGNPKVMNYKMEGDKLIDANPLANKAMTDFPFAYTNPIMYNYNRGGLRNPKPVIPTIDNGRSLLEIDNLDYSNYYNSRK